MHAIKALQKQNSSKYRLKRKRKRKFITLRKKERERVLVFVIAPSYSFLPASLVLLLHFCLVIHHLPKMPSLASAGQLHTKRPHEPPRLACPSSLPSLFRSSPTHRTRGRTLTRSTKGRRPRNHYPNRSYHCISEQSVQHTNLYRRALKWLRAATRRWPPPCSAPRTAAASWASEQRRRRRHSSRAGRGAGSSPRPSPSRPRNA
jgi:hypothetical protein